MIRNEKAKRKKISIKKYNSFDSGVHGIIHGVHKRTVSHYLIATKDVEKSTLAFSARTYTRIDRVLVAKHKWKHNENEQN